MWALELILLRGIQFTQVQRYFTDFQIFKQRFHMCSALTLFFFKGN
jgi:hypothetical protein